MVDTVLAVRPDAFQTRKSAKRFVNDMIEKALERGHAGVWSFEFQRERDDDGIVRMFVCVADLWSNNDAGDFDDGFVWRNATVGFAGD